MSGESNVKICITSEGDNLDSKVDPRFGRCKYFVIADTGTLSFEAVLNPNMEASGGAGIQSGQFVIDKKVSAILTGNIGPNAFQTLQAGGVKVIIGVSGTVKEAVEKYKKGEFNPIDNPNVGSRFGIPPRS